MTASESADGMKSPLAIRVVAAEGIDRRACRMLLPDTPGAVGWSQLLVAKDAETGSILGAAKGMPVRAERGNADLRIAIHVPKPFRRRGVATALLDHLTAQARKDSVGAVVGLLEPQERDEALPFFASRGFRSVDRMTTFESKVEVMADWLFERRTWLWERGEIPASARIVPLREAPIRPVAELHARSIAGTVPQLEAFFTDLARGPDGGDSVVLLVDDVVCGYHHCEYKGDCSTTHALAISEDLRGGGAGSGWAGLLLLADRVEECTRRGIVRSRYSCLSTVRPTLRLAKLFQAEVVGIGEYLQLELEPGG
ncbi:MAG: GNAT family N-acetyltransferase [Planctomycetia bacterium]